MSSDHVVNMCSYRDGQSCTRELVLIAHQRVCNKMNPTNHTQTLVFKLKNVNFSLNPGKVISIHYACF